MCGQVMMFLPLYICRGPCYLMWSWMLSHIHPCVTHHLLPLPCLLLLILIYSSRRMLMLYIMLTTLNLVCIWYIIVSSLFLPFLWCWFMYIFPTWLWNYRTVFFGHLYTQVRWWRCLCSLVPVSSVLLLSSPLYYGVSCVTNEFDFIIHTVLWRRVPPVCEWLFVQPFPHSSCLRKIVVLSSSSDVIIASFHKVHEDLSSLLWGDRIYNDRLFGIFPCGWSARIFHP